MRLPDFIARAVAFFDKTEAKLAQLEKAATPPADPDNDGDEHCDACAGTGKCKSCDGSGKMEGKDCSACSGSGKCEACDGKGSAMAQVVILKAAVGSLNLQLSNALGLVQTREAELNTKTTEIVKLTSDLATEKRRANEVIAAQGLPPAAVPAILPAAPGSPSGENAWSKYHRLLSENPVAAGAFWRDSANEILAARPKS